jgi:hypothetical protein
VVEDGVIVGRIFKVPIAPQDHHWMWASGHNGEPENICSVRALLVLTNLGRASRPASLGGAGAAMAISVRRDETAVLKQLWTVCAGCSVKNLRAHSCVFQSGALI